LLWVKKNTTLKFNIDNDDDLETLPANVRLFLVKYNEIMNLRVGIASESISNLSQSFNSTDINSLIWQAAEELLGDEMQSQVKVYGAKDRWY
jgi:hypothetical protein